MPEPEVRVSFRARLDPDAFQRAKPFIAAASGKTMADYQHDHEYVADFLLGMDAYAQQVGSQLIAPLDAGIEFIDFSGAGDPNIITAPAPVEVEIEIPGVWADLVGTTVPQDAPTGEAALHDPRPHKDDVRAVQVKQHGVLVIAILKVNEQDGRYEFEYSVVGPNEDRPGTTGAFDSIQPLETSLLDSGLPVRVTPKVVPIKRGAGYTFPELLAIANRQYEDGLLEAQALKANGDVDYDNLEPGLERYLVVELFETFDPDADKIAQLEEAIRVIRSTGHSVDTVLRGLEAELDDIDP